jgi:hypothetical protein
MASNRRLLRHERAVLVAPLLGLALAAPGCAVVSVAGTAASVAGSAAGTAVSVVAVSLNKTSKRAPKLVEKTVDLAVPGSPPAPAK